MTTKTSKPTRARLDPSAINVRVSEPADRDALVELDLASDRHHVALDPSLYRVPDREAVAAFLDRRLSNPGRRVLVAVVDGIVIGMVDVTIDEPDDDGSVELPVPTADIGISVLDGWRGVGVGRALMAAAEASARARGAQRIVLDMSSANIDALRFYHDLGYVEYGLLLRRELD